MKAILIISIMLVSFQLYAFQSMDSSLINDNDIIGFTIEPSFGYMYGQVREIVYDTGNYSTKSQSSFNGYYLSELVWDLSNIFYVGISSSVNIRNRFYINAGLWSSINEGTGYMNDYDWELGVPLHDRDGRTDLSKWSLSSVGIVDSFIFDINLTYNFFPDTRWDFSVLGGFKSLYWYWDDTVLDSFHDGVADVLTVGIDGIDYKILLSVPYFGIGGGWISESGYFIKGLFIYSPFVMGNAHDHHYRSAHYYDTISFGQYLSASLKTGYKFSKMFSIFFQMSGHYLFETRGDTDMYNESGQYLATFPGGAGMQYQSLSISINSAFSF